MRYAGFDAEADVDAALAAGHVCRDRMCGAMAIPSIVSRQCPQRRRQVAGLIRFRGPLIAGMPKPEASRVWLNPVGVSPRCPSDQIRRLWM
jgi:hypothetical protein